MDKKAPGDRLYESMYEIVDETMRQHKKEQARKMEESVEKSEHVEETTEMPQAVIEDSDTEEQDGKHKRRLAAWFSRHHKAVGVVTAAACACVLVAGVVAARDVSTIAATSAGSEVMATQDVEARVQTEAEEQVAEHATTTSKGEDDEEDVTAGTTDGTSDEKTEAVAAKGDEAADDDGIADDSTKPAGDSSGLVAASDSSSSGSSSTTSSSSSTGSSSSSKAKHTHTWVAQTKTVHHDAVTKTETVPAKTKTVHHDAETCDVIVCHCGATFYSVEDHENHAQKVLADSNYSDLSHTYQVKTITTTPAWDETIIVTPETTKTVVVTPAYDETVTTGYVCSTCGATK